MTDKLFWEIVAQLDWSKWPAQDDADPDAFGESHVLEPAIRKLTELPVQEIYLFHEFLCWRLYTLDTREHALHFAPGQEYRGYVNDELPFSTDSFMDCRAMVIAKGKLEYERVLADPKQMATDRFETFAYLPMYAFRRKTGVGYEYETDIHIWAGSNKAGWMTDAKIESMLNSARTLAPVELRPALTPPLLDPVLIAQLAKLADRLDGARPADCDEVLAMLARFNQLAGVAMDWHAFQGFNGATSPEDFVRDILHRKMLAPDPDLTREEMAEIVSRIVAAGPDHEFYLALFCVNCKHPSETDLLYWPDHVPDFTKDHSPTNEEIAECAMGWEPRVVAMQVDERRGGNVAGYYLYTFVAPSTPSTHIVTELDEKYEKGTVLAIALKGMRLKDGSIVETRYPHRAMSCGKILGATSAAVGTRLE